MMFGNGAVLDAFTLAFRLPNLARRMFGEGALTAAFLPAFVRQLENEGPQAAWRFASAVFCTLLIVLCFLVLSVEAILWGLATWGSWSPETSLLITLMAVLTPYLIFICLTALLSAILNALHHFSAPAIVPVVLNIAWIAGIWLLAPQFSTEVSRITAIAVCVCLAGLLQFAVPLFPLSRLGARFEKNWGTEMHHVQHLAQVMLPVVLGLSITQLNTLSDSVIAWIFSSSETGQQAADHGFALLNSGTASALYFGQRLYQFPLGVFGVALSTVLFPLLAQHAERGEFDRLQDDLLLGMKLVILVGLPASLGLMILAEPLTVLLFQYGKFNQFDVEQTSQMIAAYGAGVWAYCGLLIVLRGYYAIGDRQTPVKLGVWLVGLNLVLNLTLIYPLGGQGLAWSTAICAMINVVLATWLLQSRIGRLNWSALKQTTVKALIATGVMSAVCFVSMQSVPVALPMARALRVVIPITLSVGVYFLLAWLMKIDELSWLIRRKR